MKKRKQQADRKTERDRDRACCVRQSRAEEWTATLHIITPSPARQETKKGEKKGNHI